MRQGKINSSLRHIDFIRSLHSLISGKGSAYYMSFGSTKEGSITNPVKFYFMQLYEEN